MTLISVSVKDASTSNPQTVKVSQLSIPIECKFECKENSSVTMYLLETTR